MKNAFAILLMLSMSSLLGAATTDEDSEEQQKPMSAATFSGLKLRGIGPAINSGRISDLAVTPKQTHRYFVAVASGGVWKTENAGTTWTPVFDGEGSYSIGCITMDPRDPNLLWVGTGENNSQRSVSFGDGVYRSRDGGVSWENMGLEESEHVGMIAIDPRDTDVVYVAAQGPLWRPGGDRGLYKTTDGGASWEKVLEISENTGVSEVHMDPRDPDLLYAVAYQRRRRVWTLINGGPESAIYKSTDAGASWRKLEKGLPKVDLGRIGLAVAPADPDVIYAIVEAAEGKGGVFRSTNRGESWEKRSDYMSTSPQYYNEIVADPKDVDTLYSMDTWLHVSVDGGASFTKVPEEHKHVDNHAMWIDPSETDHLLVGCDGGVYESFDRGQHWTFKENLPITQFYRVTVDNSTPFYFIYGGTQDNNTLGGPSRTRHSSGISNEDWFVTVGGDGYETQVDPTNPDIVYSEWQYGGLVRYDRRSGERVSIQPQEEPGEDAHRWNWDSPLLISPHSPSRLYFACQRLFRSDDRGSSWTAVSPDLSRGIDRDTLPVMGVVWGPDAVSKNRSTSAYGNIVSLSESPLVEGLIYLGTDDGLIQVTEDGGSTWRKVERFPGVPGMTYVSDLEASLHDRDTVYAAFDNHKNGDFKPYLLKSSDRGRSWRSIAAELPERDVVWTLALDHENDQLIFAGTEFGLYFSPNQGARWIKLEGGLPTIQVRELDVQRQENDLALATFGRGFYILDDYSPLRHVTEESLEQEAVLFPIRDAKLYVETSSRQMSRGDGFWTADNPPYGAVFSYYLKDGLKTRAEARRKAEKEVRKQDKTPPYPSREELRAEHVQIEPRVLLVVRDEAGGVVQRITTSREKGIHRASWDLRYPSTRPTALDRPEDRRPKGRLALPGRYSATLVQEVDGVVSALAGPEEFDVVALDLATLPAEDAGAAKAFYDEVAELRRAVHGAIKTAEEAGGRLAHVRHAIIETPAADEDLLADAQQIQTQLDDIMLALRGDESQHRFIEPTSPKIRERVDRIARSQWNTTSAPTRTQRKAYDWAADAFAIQLEHLHEAVDGLESLEQRLEEAGGPWTPGRMPTWRKP